MQSSLTEKVDAKTDDQAIVVRDAAPVHRLDLPEWHLDIQPGDRHVVDTDKQRSIIDERRGYQPTTNQVFQAHFIGRPSDTYRVDDTFIGKHKSLLRPASSEPRGTRPYRADVLSAETTIKTTGCIAGTEPSGVERLSDQVREATPVSDIGLDNTPYNVAYAKDDAYEALRPVIDDVAERFRTAYEQGTRQYRITDLLVGEPYIHSDAGSQPHRFNVMAPVLSIYGRQAGTEPR